MWLVSAFTSVKCEWHRPPVHCELQPVGFSVCKAWSIVSKWWLFIVFIRASHIFPFYCLNNVNNLHWDGRILVSVTLGQVNEYVSKGLSRTVMMASGPLRVAEGLSGRTWSSWGPLEKASDVSLWGVTQSGQGQDRASELGLGDHASITFFLLLVIGFEVTTL